MQKNKKPPLVSVILPTYNRAWSLEAAIDSVLSQDFDAFELIVVDDGSTDGTDTILSRYGSRLRKCFQPNRGVAAARNAGIQRAAGRYIAFLDSDDLWLPRKLSLQVAFHAAHPETRISQTDEIWIRRGIRVNPKRYHMKSSGDLFERSLERCMISPSAVMVQRMLFDEVGFFDEKLPACEDYDLWLRVACRYPIPLIPHAVVVKRGGHADQLSRAPGLDRFRIRALVNLLESGCLTEAQRRVAGAMIQRKIAVYAGGCLKRHRRPESLRYQALAQRILNL